VTEIILSIDVGTTATAAAVWMDGEVRQLAFDGRSSMSSAVLVDPDGRLVVGQRAEELAVQHPERVERTPKRRLGDPVMLLGDHPVRPVDAVAAILRHVVAESGSLTDGAPPDRLVLTHPARWGSTRREILRSSAEIAELPVPVLVAEPVAAAAHLATDLTGDGDLLGVYDLGGGTLDTAIVRRTDRGFEVAGPPGGDDSMGGEAFDDMIVAELMARLEPSAREQVTSSPDRAWQQARLQLRADGRAAKEALSSSSMYRWYAGEPLDIEMQVSQSELEELLVEPIRRTVESMLDTIRRSGLSPDQLATVVMVGGSARSPLVGRLLAQAVGRPPTTWGDPKAAVCLGALTVARSEADPTPSVPVREPAQTVEPTPLPEPSGESSAPEDGPWSGDPGGLDLPAVSQPHVEPTPEVTSVASSGQETPVDSWPGQPAELTDAAEATAPVDDGGAGVSGPAWTRGRIGATVAAGLVALGVVSGVLAFLLR
jgi:molecular chaperone DnaK (HSP70)